MEKDNDIKIGSRKEAMEFLMTIGINSVRFISDIASVSELRLAALDYNYNGHFIGLEPAFEVKVITPHQIIIKKTEAFTSYDMASIKKVNEVKNMIRELGKHGESLSIKDKVIVLTVAEVLRNPIIIHEEGDEMLCLPAIKNKFSDIFSEYAELAINNGIAMIPDDLVKIEYVRVLTSAYNRKNGTKIRVSSVPGSHKLENRTLLYNNLLKNLIE